jgi:hypothetical protein
MEAAKHLEHLGFQIDFAYRTLSLAFKVLSDFNPTNIPVPIENRPLQFVDFVAP